MTPPTFLVRVTVESAAALGVLALASATLSSPRAGIGVLAGGALALGNLWWLAGGIFSATARTAVGRWWSLGAVLRLGATGAAALLVLATGLAHPVGVVIGLTVLPIALIARGLTAARQA